MSVTSPMLELCFFALLTGCGLVFLQRLATPGHGKHFFFADCCAFGLGLYFLGFFYLPSGRAFFAALCTVLIFAVLALINFAKRKALRNEHLLFSDWYLVRQIILFPSLYLPFLPIKILLFGSVLVTPLLIFAWKKSTVFFCPWLALVWVSLPILFALCYAYPPLHRRLGSYLHQKVPVVSSKDPLYMGPLGAVIVHVLWHLFCRGRYGGILAQTERPFAKVPWREGLLDEVSSLPKARLPHILLIQEESFCDPRAFTGKVPTDLLPTFDAMGAEGFCGSLRVHAYGAYTMRTEYEVLTGITAKALGTDSFHPYCSAKKYPSWSLAQLAKRLGYQTVCIHPFAKSFFYRDAALPNLGFDTFCALEDFPFRDTFGPYISDASVGKTIVSYLAKSSAPTFCFVITMENHGPWLKGRFGSESAQRYAQKRGLPHDLEGSLLRYLIHVQHADDLLCSLREALLENPRDAVLGLYGDHLPGLSSLIPKTASRKTPCLVWNTAKILPPAWQERHALEPAELGGLLLEEVVSVATQARCS